MKFNPKGTKWSVAAMDNDGKIEGFHPVHWEFHDESMNAGDLWVGGYREMLESEGSFSCQIQMAGNSAPSDSFEVIFLTEQRFIATKNGVLYRFGKKV